MHDFKIINYKHATWRSRCIFTGSYLDNTKRGEHVIPRWLIKDYEMKGANVELGSKRATAQIREFTAPAEEESNNLFGELENRIKLDQTSVHDDELHLWLMKMSCGLLWNHCRLAQNSQHPNAPGQIDERLEGIHAGEFRSGFSDWKNGQYVRKGSLLRLPHSVGGLFLAHSFGAHMNDKYSDTHDAILPFVLIAFGRPGHDLLIATFFDNDRALEEPSVSEKWLASIIPKERCATPVRAAIAGLFYEKIVKLGYRKMTGEDAPKELFSHIASTFGIEIFLDEDGEIKFRSRA